MSIKIKRQTRVEWNIPKVGSISVEIDDDQKTTVMLYDKRYTYLSIHLEDDLEIIQVTLEMVRRTIEKAIQARRKDATSATKS